MLLHFSSLRSRLLLLATLPLAVMLSALLWIGHRTTTDAVESAAADRLESSASILRELVDSRQRALLAQARVTAADPRFFATFSVPEEDRGDEFVRTMELITQDFLHITDADFIEVYDKTGTALLRVARDADNRADWRDRVAGRGSILAATARAISSDAFLTADGAVLVVDAPVFLGHRQEAVLRMGLVLDERFAEELRALTGTELALGNGDVVAVSTWQEPLAPLGPPASSRTRIFRRMADGEEHLCVLTPFDGVEAGSGFVALLGSSTSAALAPLHRAERLMGTIGLIALLATVIGGVSIAVGVTRPLHELMHAANRIREGDYSEPVPQSGRDEVAGLARSLEDSRQALQAHVRRLEDLDRRRGEFLSLAGHELRTPLTVITSFNDMIHEGGFGELPPEVTETTAVISEQLSHLNELVTDILDLTSLETAPDKAISVSELDLVEIVDAVNQRHLETRAGRGVEVRWERPAAPLTVRGDERLLSRAVRALLDNAVRFTPDGGRVDIALIEKSGEHQLSIADDGIGISPDEVRWIYDKLYEGSDIDHHSSGGLEFRSGGMGIGLSITRGVVAAHGGRLDVESHPGQGSCFTMTLPSIRSSSSVPELAGITRQTPEGLRC